MKEAPVVPMVPQISVSTTLWCDNADFSVGTPDSPQVRGMDGLLHLIPVGKVMFSGVLCLKMKLLVLDHVLCQQRPQAGCLAVGTHNFSPLLQVYRSFATLSS